MLAVKNLEFTYRGAGARVIKGLDFAVQKGEIFGFLGPSGAGKSTTQKILIGLLKGYRGEASVLGRDLRDWRSEFYEHIGVSFELPNHYQKLTGLENLEFFRAFYSGKTEDPRRLLAMVGLVEAGKMRVAQYSKGMAMRLTFARALLNRPELIFLDEPTAGLDPVNARMIKDIILTKKAEGKTIFLTTHNMTVADSLCDRVAFIVDGEIKLTDTPRELKIRGGERRIRVEYHEEDHTGHQEFPLDGLGGNEQFLLLIRDKKIETIHTMEATLEDVFIQATGRTLS